MNGTNENLSSASIFEHVDRISRTTDASRRLPNKVQLIAMQPMPVPPLHSPPINGKLSDTNQINKEVCTFENAALQKLLFLANRLFQKSKHCKIKFCDLLYIYYFSSDAAVDLVNGQINLFKIRISLNCTYFGYVWK